VCFQIIKHRGIPQGSILGLLLLSLLLWHVIPLLLFTITISLPQTSIHFSAVIFHYRLRNFVTWIKLVKALLIFNVATVRVL
jgi:hypothetical protein